MTDKNIKTQLYLIGQVYGKICKEYPELDTPERLEKVCTAPMSEMLKAQMAAIQLRPVSHDLNDYIMHRICAVDEEMIDYHDIPVTHKACVVSGYEDGKADFNAKALIDKCGLTQQQIADKLGVLRNVVGRWYRGETNPKAVNQFELEKLCRGGIKNET